MSAILKMFFLQLFPDFDHAAAPPLVVFALETGRIVGRGTSGLAYNNPYLSNKFERLFCLLTRTYPFSFLGICAD